MGPRANLRIAVLLSLLGLGGILWLGGPIEDPAGGARTWTADRAAPSLALQESELAAAIRIQERSDPRLFRIPGVQATAVGWTAAGRPAIHLYVERAMAGLPEAMAALPETVEGLPVVVRTAGPFRALQESGAGPARSSRETRAARVGAVVAAEEDDAVDRFGRFERPVPIGVSTGHPDVTAGTIGALVTDGLDTYALSNYHVYVVSPRARLGDNVLQPGPADGGVDPGDAIGALAAFVPIERSPLANNRIDAAIARTTQVAPRTPSDGYGAPREDPVRARPGMAVQKYGRTTGHTLGEVDAINATVSVRYRSGGTARFTGQVILCCSFSRGGDSGSLIVRHDIDEEGEAGADDRRPVGLLFAGDGRFTIANPIDEVLDAFGVRIVGDRTP